MCIFRGEPVSVNGKATRKSPKYIGSMHLVPIPDTILDIHPMLKVSLGYVYVQTIYIMHSISSKDK